MDSLLGTQDLSTVSTENIFIRSKNGGCLCFCFTPDTGTDHSDMFCVYYLFPMYMEIDISPVLSMKILIFYRVFWRHNWTCKNVVIKHTFLSSYMHGHGNHPTEAIFSISLKLKQELP